MTRGTILNIQRFCTDDGPGIRTTVFLKGCPLGCIWCHNPESQSARPEILYNAETCLACRRCESFCPQKCHTFRGATHVFDRSLCVGCGACVPACPGKSLELRGQTVSVEEVLEEVERDRIFYEESGGGVTLSGGEPLFQPEFSSLLLEQCKKAGIHTAMETCGFAEEEVFLSVLGSCDFVLFDLKETDPDLHLRYTGVPLEPILRNLSRMNGRHIPFVLRAPVIPTLNSRESHLKRLCAIRDSMSSCLGIQLMPYHRTGVYKYALLNRSYACGGIPEPSGQEWESWNKTIGIRTKRVES